MLGELLSTDGKGDGQDGRHGDRDTTNEQDEDVVKTAAVGVVEGRVQDDDFKEDEDTDGDETEGSNLGENLLQVTGGLVVLTDEGSGTTEEGVGTGGDDDTLSFTGLASGTTESETVISISCDTKVTPISRTRNTDHRSSSTTEETLRSTQPGRWTR